MKLLWALGAHAGSWPWSSPFVAAEWHGQAAANSRLTVGLIMHSPVGRVMRPQNSYLGFPKLCQMSSLFNSSKIVVLKNHTQLVFPNYEGGIYLKTFKII